MTSSFWRGQGPEPGMPVWLDSFHEQVYEHSMKILMGEPVVFNIGKWRAAVSLRQSLQWMENAYQSPNVLKHAEKAAQEPLEHYSWTGDPDWLPGFEIKTTRSWADSTAEEILGDIKHHLQFGWTKRFLENG